MNVLLLLLSCLPTPPRGRDTAGRVSGGLCCHYFNTLFLNKLYRDVGEYKCQNVSATLGHNTHCGTPAQLILSPWSTIY